MQKQRMCSCAILGAVLVFLAAASPVFGTERKLPGDNFSLPNLVAWCIVPFDAAKRGPEARAQMLKGLGLTKLAYDWRAEHIPKFEEEILALRKHDIEFFAFWGEHDDMFGLFEKYGIAPQVWKTAPSPKSGTQEEKVRAAAVQLIPLAERTKKLGCKLGLYNHGGWGGEPENLIAVCKWLRENAGADHVGIVYNFHHGHEHMDDFAEVFAQMKPYLLCLNLNGMEDGEMILPLGQGDREEAMIKTVLESGYAGPIGILDHRNDTDAEESLRENLEGLHQILRRLGEKDAR